MLIGIISDTHDHVPHIKKAVEVFKKSNPDIVIHCGDYCSPFTIPPFEGVPLQGIFGNNDGDGYLLMEKFSTIGAELKGEFFEMEADGNKLAVYHGTYQPITDALIESGSYDVVISGHTHETVNKQVENTLAINPGTAHGFGERATIALLDTESMRPEFVEL
ncbi:MAG: metallophosphoesterase [Balneolaceae bacterium]|nr:metallophosphoesterase [Balneolaceae bacterium]